MHQGCLQPRSECEHGSAVCGLLVGPGVKRRSWAPLYCRWKFDTVPCSQNCQVLLVSYVQPQWAKDGKRWHSQYPVSPANHHLETLAASDIGHDSGVPHCLKGLFSGQLCSNDLPRSSQAVSKVHSSSKSHLLVRKRVALDRGSFSTG